MASSNQFSDAIQAMLVREFYLEPHLADEFKAAWVLSLVAQCFVRPASKVLAAKLGIPALLIEKPIRAIMGEKHMALPVRAFSDWLAWLKSADDNYRSCCRSALCYAINGSHEWAFGALRVAASKHDDWSRHHHFYGLIHGVAGNHERSLFELDLAQRAEPYEDVRQRIAEAASLCDADRQGLLSPWPIQNARLPKAETDLLPEIVQLILEVMSELRGGGGTGVGLRPS